MRQFRISPCQTWVQVTQKMKLKAFFDEVNEEMMDIAMEKVEEQMSEMFKDETKNLTTTISNNTTTTVVYTPFIPPHHVLYLFLYGYLAGVEK